MIKLQRYFIFANPYKFETFNVAEQLLKQLTSLGAEVFLEPWLCSKLGLGKALELDKLTSSFNAIISLGGDGTLLRSVQTAAKNNVPILGINMGRLGFLMEASINQSSDIANRLIKNDFQIEKRMLLNACVNKKQSYFVLNDIALMRGKNPSSIAVEAFADGDKIFRVHGDGVLVSTPTGTTGYSISAGGPVIFPDLDCIAVVPICSHVLHHRPVVLPADRHITLSAEKAPLGRTYQVVIDGQISLEFGDKTKILIEKANKDVSFIRFSSQNFLKRLLEKQAEWSRD
ncbi:MAG: NAD(+)/NADH kinase [Christensenellales bacterium]